ncbi:MAG: type II toxin-antitoxin system VapB family antitoxin, partial [Acidobacteriaceae bacterium]|nr:type II toxin-antitoxin system VapB family antitoxin [Acidobacteriaceae bacterium]
MDMALHIVDPEVDALLNTYLTGTGLTKTEAIRRLLQEAVQRNRKKEKKAGLDAVL